MQPFTQISGPAASLPRDNIDTDVIIRIERLAGASREELGRYALEALRYREDGSEEPDFVLNRDVFRTAPILIVGKNFGCGSSREGAVWALLAAGLRCVIAESFGDIFYNNCFQNGMLPIALPAEIVQQLTQQGADAAPFTVDLFAQKIVVPSGREFSFEIDPQRRQALLMGLDDLSRTLKSRSEIEAWQARDRQARPWIWLRPGTVLSANATSAVAAR
jgi:3-isopropylmalate/(R)-2-methylmalate dehydratase small subunit